jgi:hypothetical protein
MTFIQQIYVQLTGEYLSKDFNIGFPCKDIMFWIEKKAPVKQGLNFL